LYISLQTDLATLKMAFGYIEALRSKLRRIFDPSWEKTIPFLLAFPAASRGECARERIHHHPFPAGHFQMFVVYTALIF
jgi:hypothetical protein